MKIVSSKACVLHLTELFSRLLKSEDGSAAVFVAVSLTVILGMMGLAIDVGQLRLSKQSLQMAADAAALAAALELTNCGSTPNCSTLKSAAQSTLTENSFTGSTLLTNCATSSTTALTLTVNNGPCALGAANPHNGNTNYVEVVLHRKREQQPWVSGDGTGELLLQLSPAISAHYGFEPEKHIGSSDPAVKGRLVRRVSIYEEDWTNAEYSKDCCRSSRI